MVDDGSLQKVVCIVQARMGSTRLPGKSMMDLGGKPVVQHVLDRAQSAKRINTLVLATSVDPRNQTLIELAKNCRVATFIGSENDLVDRYYRAAVQFGAGIVVRIPADNPLIHGNEVDRIIDFFLLKSLDFASNLQPLWGNGYPDGIGAEVFSFRALEWLHREVQNPRHREHVTTYFIQHPEQFKVGSCKCPVSFSRPEIKLDVNTGRDMEFLRRLFADTAHIGRPIDMFDIIRWYDQIGHTLTRD